MKKFNLLIISAIVVVIGACSTGTNLTKTTDEATLAYNSGDYTKALEYYETIIADYKAQGKENECPVYFNAGESAKQLGLSEKAMGYFDQNRHTPYIDGDTYYELSKLYRGIDNLSKELDALETYLEKYPEGDKTGLIHQRLFGIYMEIKEWEKAIAEWEMIPIEKHSDPVFVDDFFVANKALENDSVCDQLAGKMLAENENNLLALDWMGKKYFWVAENRYQAELEAYDKNKTNRQYNKLLKALEVVSDEFKKSLGYFKTLYEQDPTPKTAKYMGNIYNRLDQKKTADYYYRLAGE